MKNKIGQILFGLAIFILLGVTVQAATFTVTNTNDSGAGSLRDALAQTGTNNQPDTIVFDAAVFNVQRTITLTSGELVVPADSSTTMGQMVTITGTGANLLTISGNSASRVFYLDRYAQASLSGLTVSGGKAAGTTNPSFDGDGGGIYVYNGILNLNNIVINNNSAVSLGASNNAKGRGGGIYYNNAQSSTTDNSTFSNNLANTNNNSGLGSAVCICGSTPNTNNHTITNSSFRSNQIGANFSLSYTVYIILGVNATISNSVIENNAGGGLSSNSLLTVENTTIRGNSQRAIISDGNLTLKNSTLNDNRGEGVLISPISQITTITNSTISGNDGNGINILGSMANINSSTITLNKASGLFFTGNCNFRNSVFFGNGSSSNSTYDIEQFGIGIPLMGSQGYNIIGTTNGIPIPMPGDQFGVDPLLAPLANNGGQTQTHALMANSPAIDKGNSSGLTTDQRGFTRPVDNDSIPNATGGDGADIGAFEVQAPTAASVSVGGRVLTDRGRGLTNDFVVLTDKNGNTRTARTTAFGYYRFADVAAGETYILSVRSKRYSFAPQVVSVTEDLTELNFTAQAMVFQKLPKIQTLPQ